jgi:DNA-binding transcriptional MerR regulator
MAFHHGHRDVRPERLFPMPGELSPARCDKTEAALDPGTGSRLYLVFVSEGLLSIGDVAGRCGVSRDTIRHYERKGVITNVVRNGSGYRQYSPAVIDRVRIIRRAIEIGFTLDELSRIFRQRTSGHPPCRQVRELASRKLADVERQLAALQTLRTALTQIIASWDVQLRSTAEGEMAHLLDSLIDRTEDFS